MMKCLLFKEPPADFHAVVEVASCFCRHGDKILLLERHASRPQGGTWCVPAGKLEKGEDPLSAAIREVREEVGIEVKASDLKKIGMFYVRLPHVDYVHHIFYTKFNKRPEVQLGLDEHVQAVWIIADEALTLPLVAGGNETICYYQQFLKEEG